MAIVRTGNKDDVHKQFRNGRVATNEKTLKNHKLIMMLYVHVKKKGETASTSSRWRMAGPMSLLNASNSGWYSMGSSVTNIPVAASMATRPCWTSASRHCFMVARGVPVAKPRGSNPSSNGAKAPGRPNANFDPSGTHPLSSARTDVETRLLLAEGAKAAAVLRRVARMVNFIVIDLLLLIRIMKYELNLFRY